MAGGHPDGECLNEIGAGALREQCGFMQPVIPRNAGADLVERRDFAGQLFDQRDDVNGVRPKNRAGERLVGCQFKGGLGETPITSSILPGPNLAAKWRGDVNEPFFLLAD